MKTVLNPVRDLSSWACFHLQNGPASTRMMFLEIMDECERFILNLDGNIEYLAQYEKITRPAACLLLKKILYGYEDHDLDWDCPSLALIKKPCMHLGLRAPEGWHKALMRKSSRYRLMHHPRKRI